jgi:ABC-type transporter Mla MlaB component
MSLLACRRLYWVRPGPPSISLAIRGPIERTDLPGLSLRVCSLFARNPGKLVLTDVADVEADAVCVDAQARRQLVAQRNGCRVVLINASPALLDLVEFMALDRVLSSESC